MDVSKFLIIIYCYNIEKYTRVFVKVCISLTYNFSWYWNYFGYVLEIYKKEEILDSEKYIECVELKSYELGEDVFIYKFLLINMKYFIVRVWYI